MVPDTRYAILGLLLRQPSHGYELAVRFGELFGPGWEINRGQVYDMVHTLEDNGLVERLPGAETRRRSQRYRATQKGARMFAKWLGAPSAHPRPHRDTLYLKLALAGPEDASHLLESIAVQEQACLDRLRTYAQAPRAAARGTGEWQTLARDLIDEATTSQLHGELEWLAKMRNRIERLIDRSQGSTAIGCDEISSSSVAPLENSMAS
jgi:DNA-binding PadR family transcriptional regulator